MILPTNAIFYVHAFGSSWKTTYKHLVWSTAMKFWRNCPNLHYATRQLIFASTTILLSQPENQLLLTPFPVSLSTFCWKKTGTLLCLRPTCQNSVNNLKACRKETLQWILREQMDFQGQNDSLLPPLLKNLLPSR